MQSLAGYYSIIKNPISFSEIRAKAVGLNYESLLGSLGVEKDLALMCNNAKRFNAVGSAVWLASEVVVHFFLLILTQGNISSSLLYGS